MKRNNNMEISAIAQQRIRVITSSDGQDAEDDLAVEEPLEIQLAFAESGKKIKKSISVTMRTPGDDDELAVGFLFTEGIITEKSQVKAVETDVLDENKVIVNLAHDFVPEINSLERNFYTTSSCGVCGKASIDAIKTVSVYQNEDNALLVTKHVIFSLKDKLNVQQNIFESTGGLHASALFDPNGNFITLREDVGRHNALDKLIGHALLNDLLPLANKILLLSGRASFELIQKAGMAGIKIVAAIGAPSSLAVKLAEESSITLIGFLKNDKFNIYSGFDRISAL
ncbi:formate dehydrogenase accessory sulfurtransferase FdhD [Dyadobacter chenwenxiniae]|uniref:Sulfur carrier protein FdhD n=1 Tax=Dyadobacter chenwenxiniae TaxID=2906456 RepID=A0A9X1TP02_9BACT|nr:formate dehydrogenase accessory sulfurtransferase FdhD [Dyadobacter chenwenxiniae]MCF0065053.1 formate dehydrogenase accessory sulfurtransferase FdhD [Dyadobacter chenwenxiniae]UON83168.1 formate dehydrogenase accessory sulfurtransferase FdhD [Dyadobacter chenwenxiniae]